MAQALTLVFLLTLFTSVSAVAKPLVLSAPSQAFDAKTEASYFVDTSGTASAAEVMKVTMQSNHWVVTQILSELSSNRLKQVDVSKGRGEQVLVCTIS